jgi:hypothetical protein
MPSPSVPTTDVAGAEPVGEVGRARRFALQLLSNQLSGFHWNGDVNHAFPQCYWFCHSARLLARDAWLRVGQLERFSEDVLLILTDAGLSEAAARAVLARYEEQERAHMHTHRAVHSHVASRAQAAMRRAFAEDEPTQRAVCYLLVPDYVCVNRLLPPERRYGLPPACAAVHARVKEGMAAASCVLLGFEVSLGAPMAGPRFLLPTVAALQLEWRGLGDVLDSAVVLHVGQDGHSIFFAVDGRHASIKMS